DLRLGLERQHVLDVRRGVARLREDQELALSVGEADDEVHDEPGHDTLLGFGIAASG
ncbi:MAG: hypothetical protein RL176_600, partial [Pseudomonadota bacterium]